MPKRKATKHIKREPIQEDEEMVKLEREPDVGASDEDEDIKPDVDSEYEEKPDLVWDSKPDLDSDYEAKPKRRKTKGGKSGKATSQAANRASRAGTNGKKWTGAQLEALFAAATHETTLARFKDAVDGRTPAQCYSTWRWV
jgi:hypothetical protein